MTFWQWFNSTKTRMVLAIISLNVAAMTWGYFSNYSGGYNESVWYPMAKLGGALLDLNMGMVLIPVMRNIMSMLRSTPLHGQVTVLDDHVKLHKIAALGIVIGMVIHIYAHIRHMEEIALGQPRHMPFDATDEMAGMFIWEQVFVGRKVGTSSSYTQHWSTIGGHRWAHLSGLILTVYFAVMMFTATSCVRRFRSGVRNAKWTGYNIF